MAPTHEPHTPIDFDELANKGAPQRLFLTSEVIDPDETELVTEPALIANFDEGHLAYHKTHVEEAVVELLTTTAPILITYELAKKVYGLHSEYASYPGFRMLFVSGNFAIGLEKEKVEEALANIPSFVRVINDIWIHSHQFSFDKFQFTVTGEVIYDAHDFHKLHIKIGDYVSGATKDELIQAIHAFGHLLFHHAVGIAANGHKTHLHTNGKNKFVSYPSLPTLGQVPGGLKVIDLRNAHNENWEFRETDVINLESVESVKYLKP